ncbi:uncharacterized protein LOC136754950 isoform X2 [Amia ocellicauda]|uniref:uncharacterized protein LOC136754950 isoform X2 n=1 Tax=Amia ocellicauda TaxID=2972642 RepID=UPI003464CD06
MSPILWIATFCVAVCSGRTQVFTEQELRVNEGSDVRLPCTFSLSPEHRGHSFSVDWEFNQTVAIFFYLANHSTTQRGVSFVGDIWNNDACVLLHSVTRNHSGVYTCLVRPHHHGLIYRNSTTLTVLPYGSARGRMGPIHMSPEPQSSQWPLYAGCGAGLLALLLFVGVGLWTHWRHRKHPDTLREENEKTEAKTVDAQLPGKDKDTDCYVTLGKRCVPHPVSCSFKEESIYLTMHGDPCSSRPQNNRKGLPLEWCAEENLPAEVIYTSVV